MNKTKFGIDENGNHKNIFSYTPEESEIYYRAMERSGKMTGSEWSEHFARECGALAILCELSPDCDSKPRDDASALCKAAETALWEIAHSEHPKAEALLKALKQAEGEKVSTQAERARGLAEAAKEREKPLDEVEKKIAKAQKSNADCFPFALWFGDRVLGASDRWRLSLLDYMEFIRDDNRRGKRNTLRDYMKFAERKLRPKEKRARLPKSLPHPNFIEARQFSHALSDGRDGRNWEPIEGVIALLHCAPKATHSVRFEPSARLLGWWGTSGVQLDALRAELARLDLDDLILFRVVLSAVLHDEKARFSASLDDIITLIGRDNDARRSARERDKWRAKVWRSIVLFDSLAVIGTRGGKWREPGARGETRARMDAEQLYTRDPLLLISGTRDTEQGTFDGSAPPKTVSLVPGDWLMPFHGNREVLSEFGDVLPIAQIPRGKPSGAWATCAGLMLSQLWREQATRATVGRNSRGKESKVEILKFRAFTRRELLAGTLRSGFDVNEILSDPKSGHRARDYWKAAIKELKTRGVIGHYEEPKSGANWRDVWLDEPLDIRPAGEMLTDALRIHKTAQEAKKRGNRKRALPSAQSAKDDGV